MIVNKLYDDKGKLVSKVLKGNIAIVDNKVGLKNAKIVRKTIDTVLLEKINKVEPKKIPVSISCNAFVGKNLEVTISDGKYNHCSFGSIVDNALNCSISNERIKEQLVKLGGTPFICNDFSINCDDNIFISIKELNDLRRELVEKLINSREFYSSYDVVKKSIEFENSSEKNNKSIKISVFVRNENQLKACINNKVDNIIVSDFNLYKKYKEYNVFFRTRRVNSNKESFKNENLLVTELGSLYKNRDNNNIHSDYFLNVSNRYSIDFLKKLGVKDITLSVELKNDTLKYLANYSNITLFVYGRVELMIMKYCPMNMLINKNNKKCNLCDTNNYYLKDTNNNIYPIVNEKHLTHILDSKNIDLINNLSTFIEYGFRSFRLDLFDEDEFEIKKIIDRVRYSYEHRDNK